MCGLIKGIKQIYDNIKYKYAVIGEMRLRHAEAYSRDTRPVVLRKMRTDRDHTRFVGYGTSDCPRTDRSAFDAHGRL